MQIQIHITCTTDDEAVSVFRKLSAQTDFQYPPAIKIKTDTASGVQTASKPKAEPTLNEKLKAREEKAAAEPQEAQETGGEVKKLDCTYDNVKTSVLELSKKKGRDAAKAALAKFGYEKVSAEMKAEDYGNVITECQAQIAA